MKIKSNVHSPILLYPVVKWIIWIISIPFFIAIYLFLPFIFLLIFFFQKETLALLLALIIIAGSYLIPYIHTRNGWASKQILEIKDNILIVTNKWFLFSSKKTYNVISLKFIEIEPWNLLTGKMMKTKIKYSKLVINQSITLHHFYKSEELEKFISQYYQSRTRIQ